MSARECERTRQRFLDLEEGLLPPEQAEPLRAHLRQCPACRRLWDVFQAQDRLLADALQPVPAPRDLAVGVLAKVRSRPAAAKPIGRRPALVGGLTAAAGILIALGVLFFPRPHYVQIGYLGVVAGRPMAAQRGEEFPSQVADGAAVYDGATLVTGAGESLEVRLDDGSLLVLSGGTKARLSGDAAAEECGHAMPHVCLHAGEILCKFQSNKHFRAVGTPLGSAFAQRATLRVKYVPGKRTVVAVVEGHARIVGRYREAQAPPGSRWVVDASGHLRELRSEGRED